MTKKQKDKMTNKTERQRDKGKSNREKRVTNRTKTESRIKMMRNEITHRDLKTQIEIF